MSIKQDQLVDSVKSLVTQIKLRESEIETIKEKCDKIKSRINYIRTFHEDSIELTELLKNIPTNFIDATPFQENGQVRQLELENAELQMSLEEHQAAMEIIMTKYRQQIHTLIHNNHIDWPTIRQQEYNHSLEIRSSIDQICDIGQLMWNLTQYDSEFIYDLEIMSSLRLENDGLENLLKESSKFGNTTTWNMDQVINDDDDLSTTAMSESTTSGLAGPCTPDDDLPLWMSSSFCSVKNVLPSEKINGDDNIAQKKDSLVFTPYTELSTTEMTDVPNNVPNYPLKKDYKQYNGHANGKLENESEKYYKNTTDLSQFENGNVVFDKNISENAILQANQSKVKITGEENEGLSSKNKLTYITNLNKINGSMDSLEFDNLSESTLEYESDVTLASDSEPVSKTRDISFYNDENYSQTERVVDDVPSPNDVETPCALVYITSGPTMNGMANKILYETDNKACLIDQCSPKSNKVWSIEKNIRSNDAQPVLSKQVANNNQ